MNYEITFGQCKAFPGIKNLAPAFCAKMHRKSLSGEPCNACDRGCQAAKELRAPGSGITRKMKMEEMYMDRKKCKNGDGKLAVKDDLCTKCYRSEHGEAPFPSGQKASKKKPAKTARKGAKTPKPAKATDTDVLEALIAAEMLTEQAVDLCRKILGVGK